MQRKGERSLDTSAVLQISFIWGEPLNYQVAIDFALIVYGFDWKFCCGSKETFPKRI